tara:strand:+ start:139 stop:561 length:423 start_codon:yes stop_codon:yes gene_type:complete
MKTTTEATIFETLFKLTKKHVKNYKSDFEYDKKAIEKNAGKKFIHIAREHGTHLTTFHFSEEFPKKGERVKYLFSATADRKELLNSNLETLEHYIKNSPKSIYFFNGEKLIKTDKEKALIIFKKYANTLVQNWENEKLIS